MELRIPQAIVDQYPILKDVLYVLGIVQEFWHQYQNLVILVGLVLVARRLRQERLKLSERVDTLAQIVRATRDEAEVALGQPQVISPPQSTSPQTSAGPPETSETSGDNWQSIRTVWRNVRDRLELAIESIDRSRVRAKYSKFSRYTYKDVINALERDEYLRPSVANKLRSMDTTFNTLKFKPKTVTEAEVTEFKNARDFVDKWLPKLAEEEPSPEPPPSVAPAPAPAAASQAA